MIDSSCTNSIVAVAAGAAHVGMAILGLVRRVAAIACRADDIVRLGLFVLARLEAEIVHSQNIVDSMDDRLRRQSTRSIPGTSLGGSGYFIPA